MFSVDFSLAAMSTHTSWKYYKNCVWTIIAWALLSVSLTVRLGYWEWVWVSLSLLLWVCCWPQPLADWAWSPLAGRCSPVATSGQPLSSFFSTLPTVGRWHRHTPSSPHWPGSWSPHSGHTLCMMMPSGLRPDGPGHRLPPPADQCHVWHHAPVTSVGDVSVPGCSSALLTPPTKYWSGARAGVSRHQGSASCLGWPGYCIGLFWDIKVWAFYI